MRVTRISLTNFRCFTDRVFDISGQFVLLEGENGTGKTSVLEALYYACYLRSFRTHQGRELIYTSNNHCFLKIEIVGSDDLAHEIQVGISPQQKLVKVDGTTISSYKEIVSLYRVIALTEDDRELVQGAPDERRRFLDQAMVLHDPSYIQILKEYKHSASQRNVLLAQSRGRYQVTDPTFATWTEQVWQRSIILQQARAQYLADLEARINILLDTFFRQEDPELAIELVYARTRMKEDESFEEFWNLFNAAGGVATETRLGRGIFGAHLDDINFVFKKKRARVYASRGQQKLVVFLMKIAQHLILRDQGINAILLLDDFMTDFDDRRLSQCMRVLNDLGAQVFLATPLISAIFSKDNKAFDVQRIAL